MSSWQQQITQCRQSVTDADEHVKECRQALYAAVIAATNDSDTTIDSIAEVSGWSVSYIRAMRGRSEDALPRRKSTNASDVAPKLAKQIVASRSALERAEARYEQQRSEMIQTIQAVTAPTPTMAEVAEVLGISRQRVSQLLDEL